jgi:hypothetical protein
MAASHVRYGYRRLTVLLRREGWKVNAKRIYRLGTEEQLIVRTKQRRKITRRQRGSIATATAPNHCWSMDSACFAKSDCIALTDPVRFSFSAAAAFSKLEFWAGLAPIYSLPCSSQTN